MTAEEREFWRQPDGMGYRPCIQFSLRYRRESRKIGREGRRFVVALVSGGLNQQRNQIVDAVIVARILGAALVVPVLRVNVVWGDPSEFSQIFDVDHFIQTLRSDVRVVPTLPPSHRSRPPAKASLPRNVSPLWIRTRLAQKINKNGVLVLKGLDSRLSRDLPLDLQKLRCKVAFHALRFAAPIRELGAKLANRMRGGGPYVAVHLRLEKDVWVRTGCLPGIGPEFDRVVLRERRANPDLLTGRLNLTFHQRHQAGLCPLNALQVARLLRGLGAPNSTRVYWAGGEPLGGELALQSLRSEFANLISKGTLATAGELTPYTNKSSALAAIDFMVAMSSDVFVPSHGGNMARVMQGYRAYTGHMKYIRPNKHAIMHVLREAASGATEEETRREMRRVHAGRTGGPEERGRKKGRDVIAYPAPECMCPPRRRRHLLPLFV
ncbi:O-fucosyltransferase 37 [Typha angustifolia]|uniref:O-fucosyltransferase 37 n=1 Tax=Typha angustifolia TaxID=59011 RepID=UPI003C2D0B40